MSKTKRKIEQKIACEKRKLPKLEKQLASIKSRWTKGYQSAFKAMQEYMGLRNVDTQKAAKLREKSIDWPEKSIELTKKRDVILGQISIVQTELTRLVSDLALATEQAKSEVNATDEVVRQVFALNSMVVRAAADREECLKRHVFPRLVEDDKLRSQITLDSSDGLRRVVAMVNSMTKVDHQLAEEAMDEIDAFFKKQSSTKKMTGAIQAIFNLTQRLLLERRSFRVGPDLFNFLSLDLDPEVLPELARAQELLRSGISSEKTNSYIRLYNRKSKDDDWEPIRQG